MRRVAQALLLLAAGYCLLGALGPRISLSRLFNLVLAAALVVWVHHLRGPTKMV